MNHKNKRFGAHVVKKGKFKGCLHVAAESFPKFHGELVYLCDYLNRRVLPKEPEEQEMSQILLALQNVLEYESEKLIRHYVENHQTRCNLEFVEKMEDGFVSFKSKFDWLRRKSLITYGQVNIMEQIRLLRNAHIHVRPISTRQRYKYFNKTLLTTTSLRRMFLDVEKVLQKLRNQSGNQPEWGILPPRYASEMKWSKEAVVIFDKNKLNP
jgi:hypothetical protein